MSYIRSLKETRRYRKFSSQDGVTLQDAYFDVIYTGTKSGSNVPHWRSRIREGSDATSNYSLDNYQLELTPGYASWHATDRANPPYQRTSFSGLFKGNARAPQSTVSHLTTSLARANAAALKQVYDKLAQERSSTNSLATLGEMADTIRMIRHPFRAIADLTHNHVNRLVKSKRGLRGTERQRFERYYELVRESYLEYVFGLAPLISDTVAITETIARWNLESEGLRKHRSKLVGRGEDVSVSTSNTPDTLYSAGGFSVFKFMETWKQTTTRKVQYIVGVNSPRAASAGSTERLVELLGFNFNNFIPAVWEVIPWSWLVDYVANVTDLLNAGVADTSSVAWVSKSVSEDTLLEYMSTVSSAQSSARLAASSLDGSASGSMGSWKLRRTTLTRTAGVSLGIPDLVLSLPTDIKKIANVYAAVFALRAPSAFRLSNPY